MVVPLRPSSEHILIVRAPGAEDHTGFLNLYFSLLGAAWLNPRLRATFSPAQPTGTPRRAISPSEGLPILPTSLKGSGQGCPLLRASNEHIPIVRVLRARRAPGRSLSLP